MRLTSFLNKPFSNDLNEACPSANWSRVDAEIRRQRKDSSSRIRTRTRNLVDPSTFQISTFMRMWEMMEIIRPFIGRSALENMLLVAYDSFRFPSDTMGLSNVTSSILTEHILGDVPACRPSHDRSIPPENDDFTPA